MADQTQAQLGGDAGTSMLKRIGGSNWASGLVSVARTSPAMARLTVDFAYGEVLGRDGVDLVTRQCCTIAMLLGNGSALPQLKFHLHGLLNVGGRLSIAADLLVLSTAMAGFPAAIGSIGVFREVLEEREQDYRPDDPTAEHDRRSAGIAAMRRILGEASVGPTPDMASYASRFAKLSNDFEFGDVIGRSSLDDPVLRLAMIAMLAAAGGRADELGAHMSGALASGISREIMSEVLIQLSVYAGFPAALNAFAVLGSLDASPVSPDASEQWSVVQTDEGGRRERGLRTLAATSGGSGDAVVRSFDDVAPTIGALIVDHAYGEVFSNTDLDAKTRELCAIATIAARMKDVDIDPLRVHVHAASRLGATQGEIIEVIINIAPYAGYPTARRALLVATAALRAMAEGEVD
jgi:4-carboxymuconolactone decarboxylase